jgi:capsular exopolysaccharide synthesis family protein
MSRLFEALSNLEVKRGSPKVARRAVALPHAVPPDVITASVTRPETAQELQTEHHSPEEVSGAVPLHEIVRLGETGSAVVPPVSVEEVETEYRSSQGPHLKLVSPDVIPLGATPVDLAPPEAAQTAKLFAEVPPKQVGILEACSVQVSVSPESRLVALADPNSLGAEKFRALVTRLDHLRKQRELKSFQVTSSVIDEGKTLVAGNVAITFAKYSGSKTLLIEGDLHRPTLAAQFGLRDLPGLSQWWSGCDSEPTQFIYKLNEMPLWFLLAGNPCDRPSDILRSARFAKAFAQLAKQFEWIVVDSTPMSPIVDANLWSRLVDGTLLVVREGLAPVKALKKGLQALDQPKLIGVVINEASGSDQANYDGRYYDAGKS